MGFLSRLIGQKRPELDITLGDDAVRAARIEIFQGGFEKARGLMAQTTDADTRCFRAEVLSQWNDRPGAFDAWLAEHPDDPGGLLVSGAHRIRWAWEARGAGTGDTVGQRAARLFLDRLELADGELERAGALDTEDPSPHALRITVAMGLGLDIDEARARFDQALLRDPECHAAYMALAKRQCLKWGGTHEAMFAVAREAMSKAKPGSPLHDVIAFAHFERWFYATNFDPENDPLDVQGYWQQPEVRGEIAAAVDGFLAGPPSALPRLYEPANHLALVTSFAEDWPRAAKLFAFIGDRVTEGPWRMAGNPVKTFCKMRSLAVSQSAG